MIGPGTASWSGLRWRSELDGVAAFRSEVVLTKPNTDEAVDSEQEQVAPLKIRKPSIGTHLLADDRPVLLPARDSS
jgi:hypothetical protein